MLGIILTYKDCFEFLPLQLENFARHVKTPYKVYVIDDSEEGLTSPGLYDIVYWKMLSNDGGTSGRHQACLNTGLALASQHCDSFLLFDNDMIFIDDFFKPSKLCYLPQFRDQIEYMWANLLYLPSISSVYPLDFYTCPQTKIRTDSAGNTCKYLRDHKDECEQIVDLTKRKTFIFPDYYSKHSDLCKQYNITEWVPGQYDLLRINNARVFHARGMSNWMKWNPEFFNKKREMVFRFVSRLHEIPHFPSE